MATALANLLRVCDLIFGSGAIMAIITYFTGDDAFSFVGHVGEVVQVGFGSIGIVYLLARVYHYWHDSRLNRDIKREELTALRKKNEKGK